MRKINTVLTVLILFLFILHAVFGSMLIVGAGSTALKQLARGTVALIVIHALIGIKLSLDAIRISHRTGAAYFRQNRLFWARRISGICVMVLIFFHMTAFEDRSGGVYLLKEFDRMKLTLQILLILSVALHVLMNIRPLLIAAGARVLRRFEADIWIVLSVLLLVFTAAFLIYFLRWQAL